MVQLVTPTFVAGPQDDLATADIYALKSTTQVINSIQKIINDTTPEHSGVLRGGEALASALADQLPVISGLMNNGLLSINKDNLVARLAAASGSVISGLKNMSASLVAKIGSNIPDLSQSVPGASDAVAQVGAISQSVSAANLTNLSSLGRTIQEVTGTTNLFTLTDRGSQIGLFTGLIQEAHNVGLKNTFDALLVGVSDPVVLAQVAARVLPSVIANSDLGSLQAISSRLPAGGARMLYPDVAHDFAQNFQHDAGSTAAQQAATWGEVDTTLLQLDPSWKSIVRSDPMNPSASGVEIPFVAAVQNGSPDFQNMVVTQAETSTHVNDQLLVLGTVFDATTVDDDLVTHFPETVTGAELRQVSAPTDARVIGTPAGGAFSDSPPSAAAPRADSTDTSGLPDLIALSEVSKYDSGAITNNDLFNSLIYIRGVEYRQSNGMLYKNKLAASGQLW